MAKSAEEATLEAAASPVDLHGAYRFKVDAKGRVALPAKFRKALSKDLVVSQDLGADCLYVFQPAQFNDWIEQLFEDSYGKYNASDPKHVMARTVLKGRSDDVDVDSSGRIMLKQALRDAVGISKDVVLVGNTGYFEIWDAGAYDAVAKDFDLVGFFRHKSADESSQDAS